MPDRSWTLLGSRGVAQYKLIRVREDRYRFEPTGAEADFLVCESADWVLIVAVTADGEMVFVRQYRHGVGQVVVEVPGGVIDEGESPAEAAARELQEETGYRAGRLRVVGRLMPNAALNDAYCHVVLAEDCRPSAEGQNPDPLEAIDVVRYPVEQVPALIRDGQLVHALTIAAIARCGRIDLGGGG